MSTTQKVLRWRRNENGSWWAEDGLGGQFLIEKAWDGWWLDYMPYNVTAVTGSFYKLADAKEAAATNTARRKASP